jgi:hypoxanthine-DNA glycosylase
MKVEFHPYGVFIPKGAHSIIVGSFPIAKFTQGKKLKEGEIDFFYGGSRNQLWKLLSICFERELKTKKQIIDFLEEKGIAMGDVIASCQRKENGSLDSDLINCTYFKELGNFIEKNSIKKIFFTSLKVQTIFQKKIGGIKGVREVLLLSPSAGGIRRIPKLFEKEFKEWKKKNPQKSISEFRIHIYQSIIKAPRWVAPA